MRSTGYHRSGHSANANDAGSELETKSTSKELFQRKRIHENSQQLHLSESSTSLIAAHGISPHTNAFSTGITIQVQPSNNNSLSPSEAMVYLDNVSERAAHIEYLLQSLHGDISKWFGIKLPSDMKEIQSSIHSLRSFYSILKNASIPYASTASGFFSLLPSELIVNIFQHLSPYDLCKCCLVNWEFKHYSEDNSIWKTICDVSKYDIFWKYPDSPPHWKQVWRWYYECEKELESTARIVDVSNDEDTLLGVHSESDELLNFSDADQKSEIQLEGKERTDVVNSIGNTFCRGRKTYVSDNSVYKGEWLHGKRHGKGIQMWLEGDYYKGEWQNDKRIGWGIHHWPDGHSYEGEYSDDKRNGIGAFKWPDGREYRGHYVDDQRNGTGEFSWPTGDKYVGMYKDSSRNGKGIFIWKDGRQYEGEWESGGYNGFGHYIHRDNCRYIGMWKSNLRHGQGTFYWHDGDSFEGTWNEGRRAGKGKFFQRDELGNNVRQVEQDWKEEKFDKHNKGEGLDNEIDAHKKAFFEKKENCKYQHLLLANIIAESGSIPLIKGSDTMELDSASHTEKRKEDDHRIDEQEEEENAVDEGQHKSKRLRIVDDDN